MSEQAGTTNASDVADALMSLLSHDLRTPLGPLALAASTLAEEAHENDLGDVGAFASAQCARLGRLIESALLAIRGDADPRRDTVDIAVPLSRAADELKGLGITCVMSAGGIRVTCNVHTVAIAVTNLLEIAAGPGGSATVSVIEEARRVRIVALGLGAGAGGDAFEAEGPYDWRAAYALAARAVFRAHGGDAGMAGERVEAWLPQA